MLIRRHCRRWMACRAGPVGLMTRHLAPGSLGWTDERLAHPFPFCSFFCLSLSYFFFLFFLITPVIENSTPGRRGRCGDGLGGAEARSGCAARGRPFDPRHAWTADVGVCHSESRSPTRSASPARLARLMSAGAQQTDGNKLSCKGGLRPRVL